MEETVSIQQNKGGKRVAKGGGWKVPLIAAGLTVGILGGAYLGLCAYAANKETIWKNTSVLGQDLGGLTVSQAARKLDAALPNLRIGVYAYDAADPNAERKTVEGTDFVYVPVSELGGTVDTRELAEEVYDQNAQGNFLTAGARYLSRSGTVFHGEGYASPDPVAVEDAVETVDSALSWEATDTTHTIEGDKLLVTMAKDGRALDTGQLRDRLQSGAWTADLTISVPYTVTPSRDETAQEIHDDIAGEMKNAGYDAATDTITPEQVGAGFDVAAAQALMDAAAPGETVEIPAEIRQPAVTAEQLEAVLFRDLLGAAKTHVSGTAARISNVKLASSVVNGTVLNPGDVFSYNETTGQRTTAKGYLPAPAYVAGETVDEVGGGVCQPSSTLYLACLNSNLEIVERYAHRYVPAYIGKGMDATVSWGGPDYKFRNNTEYPIKIEAVYDSGYLTMNIYGTKTDDITVEMVYEPISSTPFEVVYEDDPTLAPGEEKVKTTPYTGYKGRTYRNLYDGDGKLISSTYEATSDYKVRNKVILRGPAEDVPAMGVLPGQDPTQIIPVDPDPGAAADPGTVTDPGLTIDPGTAENPGGSIDIDTGLPVLVIPDLPPDEGI